MCGITARVGEDGALEELVSGLETLEYRGYDSAGIAVQNGDGLEVCKREGEVDGLVSRAERRLPGGTVGVGHTRWSTHGAPTDANAHPHTDCSGEVAVVHNGIIRNYDALRSELADRGHEFTSETDTEVLPHLVEEHLAAGRPPAVAFRRAVSRLTGSYAVAMVVEGREEVYGARQGSPLVLGVGDGRYYLASDVPAFLEYTDEVVYLEDGDVAVLSPTGYRITDHDGRRVDRPVETVEWDPGDAAKMGYDHFMRKEIAEQPTALARTIEGRIDREAGRARLDSLPDALLEGVSAIQLVACGTSYHAALYGRQLLVSRGVAAQAFRAPEYATTPVPVDDDVLVVGVTQSGETADTLAALRKARERGARTLALTNVVGSTATRVCDETVLIRAGPEIGVAATKTFSSQVAALALLAERVDREVTGSRPGVWHPVLEALEGVPEAVESVLERSRAAEVARTYRDGDAFFFLGRGVGYPVALEGALKLKEISYEHAEGFPAGELKHGPLALVTPDTPVFVVSTGRHEDKMIGTAQEVGARGAPVVAVAAGEAPRLERVADETLDVPATHPDLAGVLANVQLQLLAYHLADQLDRPIDKPRNLAKSVTVE